MKESDIHNGEITVGSTLKDIIAVLNGEWSVTEINGWKMIKLSNKFEVATRNVSANEGYMVPIIPTDSVKAILYVNNYGCTGRLLKLNENNIKAPVSGVAIIFYM